MSGSRDGLLDDWQREHLRAATLQAHLVLAADLLVEAIDVINKDQHPRLHAAMRTFLLNTPLGGR